eukprot:12980928-Ditylum_brightwellii.AAC.1
MYRITKQQRLRQVWFVKGAKRRIKKHGLTGKEVKDLKAFVKDKIKETIKERNHDVRAMSNFPVYLLEQQEHPEYHQRYFCQGL